MFVSPSFGDMSAAVLGMSLKPHSMGQIAFSSAVIQGEICLKFLSSDLAILEDLWSNFWGKMTERNVHCGGFHLMPGDRSCLLWKDIIDVDPRETGR